LDVVIADDLDALMNAEFPYPYTPRQNPALWFAAA
jgi:hypothetical protein